MSIIGNLLREERLKKGLSLETVSEEIKVRAIYLAAIEEDRSGEDIPAPVYMLGYLKIYADFLGLDGKNIVSQLKSEIELSNLSFPNEYPDDHRPNLFTILISILLLIISYSIYYILQNQYNIFTISNNIPLESSKHITNNSLSSLFLDQVMEKNIIKSPDNNKIVLIAQANNILTILDSHGNVVKKFDANIGDIYQIPSSNHIILANDNKKLIKVLEPLIN